MQHNRSFSHTQVGFITRVVEPVHVESSIDYVKSIFTKNTELTAIPVEGDSGVIGIIEKETLLKEHGMLDNLLHGKLRYYLHEETVTIDAREHVERTLPMLLRSADEMIENCMVFHLGKFYGILNTHTLLNHIFSLRNDSLERARVIQTHLTGANTFAHNSFHAQVNVEQAHALGGDFFQMYHLTDTVSVVSCFDVSGKDIQASLLTGLISGYCATCEITARHTTVDFMQIVQNLHEIIKEKTPDDIFVAGVMIFYDSETRQITVFNMGYSPIYIITREQHTRKIRLKNPSMPPLGFPSLQCDSCTFLTLDEDPNLILFGYSDGLTDAHDHHGNEYGDSRVTEKVQEALGSKTPDIAGSLLADVREFIGKSPRTDDITVFQIDFMPRNE